VHAESSAHTPVVAVQSPTRKKHDPPPSHFAPGVVHVTTAASCAASLDASVDASFCAGEFEHAVSTAKTATRENRVLAAIICDEHTERRPVILIKCSA
jgi:ADP-heptose:LPS heptosyltransferase